jgi:exosortase J
MTLWEIWTTDPLRSIGMLIVPVAVLLTLREWRRSGWELQGIWWGLVLLILACLAVVQPRFLLLSWRSSVLFRVNLLPEALPLYLYGSGVILLFAGPRIWRRAWFPLALLLFAQPVPHAFVYLLDYPLQSFSARTARAFATLIGFVPSNSEALRLMFTPTFGMFIAPGCDGIRGAVGLGYAALIVGYLKRVSLGRWLLYVSSGVLLGHLFNLIRLCALVLYYRVAVGHQALENVAREADYVIGGVLFFIAIILFLAVVFRPGDAAISKLEMPKSSAGSYSSPGRYHAPRIAVVSILGLLTFVPAVNAIRSQRHSLHAFLRNGRLHPQDLNNLLPRQVGDFKLVRAWQEESSEGVMMESGAYRSPASDEVTLGIWLVHSTHNAHDSWIVRGESPELRSLRNYTTLQDRVVPFDTALYTDGISDRFAGTVDCTPSLCRTNFALINALSLALWQSSDFTVDDSRAVSFFFSIERPRNGTAKDMVAKELSTEAQGFLSGVDFTELSRRFQ